MTHQRKSPDRSRIRARAESKKSFALQQQYPVPASPVNRLCRACLYFREGMAGSRPRPVCGFTGERITEGVGCVFFTATMEVGPC